MLRYATGATRNLIYENSDNKAALVDAGGVARLVSILSEADEELRKTVTGKSALICVCFKLFKTVKNKFGSASVCVCIGA